MPTKVKKRAPREAFAHVPSLFSEPVESVEDLSEMKQGVIQKLRNRPGYRCSVPSLPQTRTLKGQVVEAVASSLDTSAKEISLVRKLFDIRDPAVKRVMRARATFCEGMDRWGYRCSFSPGGRFLLVQSIQKLYTQMDHIREVKPDLARWFDMAAAGRLPEKARPVLLEFIERVEETAPHYARVLRLIVENREVTDEQALVFLQDEFDRLNREFQAVVTHFNRYEYAQVLAKRREEMRAIFADGDYPKEIRFEPTFRIISLSVKDQFTDSRLIAAINRQLLDDFSQAADTIVADILGELDQELKYLEENLAAKQEETGVPHRFRPSKFRDTADKFRQAISRLGLELGFSDARLEDLLRQVELKVGVVNTSTINVLPSQEDQFSSSPTLQQGVWERREQVQQAVQSLRAELADCVLQVAPRRISRVRD